MKNFLTIFIQGLRKLTDAEKGIISLYLDDFSYREIAQIIGTVIEVTGKKVMILGGIIIIRILMTILSFKTWSGRIKKLKEQVKLYSQLISHNKNKFDTIGELEK